MRPRAPHCFHFWRWSKKKLETIFDYKIGQNFIKVCPKPDKYNKFRSFFNHFWKNSSIRSLSVRPANHAYSFRGHRLLQRRRRSTKIEIFIKIASILFIFDFIKIASILFIFDRNFLSKLKIKNFIHCVGCRQERPDPRHRSWRKIS